MQALDDGFALDDDADRNIITEQKGLRSFSLKVHRLARKVPRGESRTPHQRTLESNTLKESNEGFSDAICIHRFVDDRVSE